MTIRILCYIVIYATEAVITWQYYDRLFTRRRSPLAVALSFAMFYTTLLCLFSVHRVLLNALLYCTGNLLLLALNYRCSLKMAVLQGAILSFTLLMTELLTSVLLSGLFESFMAYQTSLSMLIAMAVISKLLYFVATTVISRLFASQKNAEEAPKMMLVFCGVPLLSLAVALISVYIGFRHGLTDASELLVVLSMLTLLAVNIVIILLYRYLQRANRENTFLQLSLQREQAELAYYSALQERVESTNILIHDFRNHVRTIDSLAQAGRTQEILAYTAQFEEQFPRGVLLRRSDDAVLNLILMHTAEQCQSEGIRFHCDVREGSTAFLDAPGKTALFGNLLSNAVEAAGASEEKEIEFSVQWSQDHTAVIITVVNSCDTAPEMDARGQYRSRKRDGGVHGIGLKSIARTVRKYQGLSTMKYDAQERRFHCIIRFTPRLEAVYQQT